GPAYDKWDIVDVLRLFEAACLWCDVEPGLPMPIRARRVFKRLQACLADKSIYPALSMREMLDAPPRNDSFATEFDEDVPINVNRHVGREALTEYARRIGARPRFLFKGARG